MSQPWENDALVDVESNAPVNPWDMDSLVDERPQGEMRGAKGFWENVENPIDLMKNDSLAANLMKFISTPKEVYEKRKSEDKDFTIQSIPLMQTLTNKLDYYEEMEKRGQLTPEMDKEYMKYQDAYGHTYKIYSKAYDKGELKEDGSVWDAFKEAVVTDPGGMLAEVANAFMADPELILTPIGWEAAATRAGKIVAGLDKGTKAVKGAEVAGGIAGSSLTAATMATAINVADQLAEKGEIDQQEVELTATLAAITAPVLIGGYKAAYKGVQLHQAAKLNKQVEQAVVDVNKHALDYVNRGLTPEQAVRRSLDRNIKNEKVRNILSESKDWISKLDLSDEARHTQAMEAVERAATWKGSWDRFSGDAANFFRDKIGATTTNIGLFHKGLEHALKRHDMQEAITLKSHLDIKDAFANSYRKLTSVQQKELSLVLFNADKSGLSKFFEKYPDVDLGKSIKDVQKMLDGFYKEADSYGLNMQYHNDFFPREIPDYSRYVAKRGYNPSQMNKLFADAINKKYKISDKADMFSQYDITPALIKQHLTEVERAALLDNFFAGHKQPSTIASKTRHVESRRIDKLELKDLEDYADPIKSLTNYITTMNMKLQARRFFGGKAMEKGAKVSIKNPEDVKFVEESIGGIVGQLLKNGEILPEDIDPMTLLLRSRFIDGARAPNKYISGTKNMLYAAVLGNPFSAGTQMGDVGASVYINNLSDTLKTIPDVFTRKVKVTMEDVGLSNIIQEFEHLGPTAKILDKSLKWSGFKAIDRLGKETVMNAALSKYQRLAHTKKGQLDIYNKYKDAFTREQMNKVILDLQNQKITPDVTYMLWHELARVQPISLSEMPPFYLRHPNLRMLYMLKTFTIKQLDLARKEALHQIRNGKTKEGVTALARYAGILGVSNASVEQVKAWVRGEDVEFGDLVIANMYRNYGISQYFLDKMEKGQLSGAVATLVMPPFNVVDNVYSDLTNLGNQFKTLDNIPPFGKGWRMMFDMEEK